MIAGTNDWIVPAEHMPARAAKMRKASIPAECTILPDAKISHIRRKFLDVVYADRSEFERLDIYLPDEGKGPFPTIIFIHGGAWYACDKRDTQIEPYLTLLPYGYFQDV